MKQTLPLFLGAVMALSAQEHFGIRVPPPAAGPNKHAIEYVRNEFGPGPVVKNAPYTAEAVTESVQVLSDGNRIVRRSSSQMARDSEGRTRRDLALTVGPLAAEAPKLSVIYDPVANVSYTLDHKAKTARKMPGRGMMIHAAAPAVPGAPAVPAERGMVHMEMTRDVFEYAPGPIMMRMPQTTAGKTESLGKQNIEGVVAEGTRTVNIIPAGEIGNERPIEIVSERWYSPELQTVVMTKHRDPRMGETQYKLTGIRRSEPLKSLFEVPADYTVREAEMPPMPPGRHMQPKPRE
jgi:hypothetical protein